MRERTSLVVQIALAGITVLLGGSAINLFVSAYVRPAVEIDLIPFAYTNLTIDIRNSGQSVPKNHQVTIDSPWPITREVIFSTENYSKSYPSDQSVFEIDMKRL